MNVKFYACVAAVLFAGYAIFSGPSAPPQVVVARAAPPAALPPIVLAPYEDNSKLDYGPSNPGMRNAQIFDAPKASGNADGRSLADIIAANDRARYYSGRVVDAVARLKESETEYAAARRALPFSVTGMKHY